MEAREFGNYLSPREHIWLRREELIYKISAMGFPSTSGSSTLSNWHMVGAKSMMETVLSRRLAVILGR
jgi:hypothetical protein